jgi:hypothetical protein
MGDEAEKPRLCSCSWPSEKIPRLAAASRRSMRIPRSQARLASFSLAKIPAKFWRRRSWSAVCSALKEALGPFAALSPLDAQNSASAAARWTRRSGRSRPLSPSGSGPPTWSMWMWVSTTSVTDAGSMPAASSRRANRPECLQSCQLLGLATATHSAQIMQPKLSDGAALVCGIALCASRQTQR